MKSYNKLLLSLAVAASGAALLSSCDEECTLDGANAVYIEITPSDITLALGDTVPIKALVTNESGKVINTPVKWSLTSDGVAQLIGDTALVCVPFDNLDDQVKQTKLRAELTNGKYRLAPVSVSRVKPKGVMPVDTAGVQMAQKTSYMISHDTIVFRVEPRQLLHDYAPSFTIEGDGLAPYETEPMRVNEAAGTVTIHYSAARKAGEGLISVSVGPTDGAVSGSCKIVMLPPIEGATFYGPEFADMPYIGSRPPCHTLRMYYVNNTSKSIDVDKTDTLRVAVNVQTGALEDIREALGTYSWQTVEGTSMRIVGMYEEIYEGHGFDAVLIVKSGFKEGTTIFECHTSTDTLTATYDVYDYKVRFPVDKVYTDSTEMHIVAGQTAILTTFVDPITSYGYQKPVVTIADPEIASVGAYIGNQLPITGLKPGQTEAIVTSYGLECRVPIYVAEGVNSVTFGNDCPITILEGQEVDWNLVVNTPTGGVNKYPSTWTSSDESIVTATANPDDVNKGIIRGISQGMASISARVLDKTASGRTVTVVPLKSTSVDLTYDPANLDNNGVETQGSNLLLTLSPAESTGYSNIEITLEGAASNGMLGQHNVAGGSIVIDGAVAEITSGTVTITDPANDEGSLSVDFTLTVAVRGLGNVTFTTTGFQVYSWD